MDINILESLAQSISIGFWAMVLSLIFSIPFGIYGLYATNHNRVLTKILTSTLSFLSLFPALLYGLIFVLLIGYSEIVGIFAIALASTARLGKFYTTHYLEDNFHELKEFVALGISKYDIFKDVLLPKVFSRKNGNSIYLLGHNFRNAMIIGVIGAGGIGQELFIAFQTFNISLLLPLSFMILAINVVINFMLNKNTKYTLLFLFFLTIFFNINYPISIDLDYFFNSISTNLYAVVFTPNFADINRYIVLILETLLMSTLATIGAVLISFIVYMLDLDFIKSFYYYFLVLPDVALAFILFSLFQNSFWIAVLVMCLHVVGLFIKNYEKHFDYINKQYLLAYYGLGLSNKYIYIYKFLLPNLIFVKYNLLIFSRNLKGAIVMGIIGVGGIGYELVEQARVLNYSNIGAILILISIVHISIEIFLQYLLKLKYNKYYVFEK